MQWRYVDYMCVDNIWVSGASFINGYVTATANVWFVSLTWLQSVLCYFVKHSFQNSALPFPYYLTCFENTGILCLILHVFVYRVIVLSGALIALRRISVMKWG